MARSKRALLRKGNVTDIAEARKQREQKQKAKEQALANARISTLEEATRDADAIKAAALVETCANSLLAAHDTDNTQVYAAGGSTPMAAHSVNQAHSVQQTSSTLQTASTQATNDPGVAHAVNNAAAQQPGTTAESSSQKKHGNRTYNTEKVEAIKQAIANGTYTINPQRIADKFIERESPA